jgi:hypothetical protein
MPLKDFNVLCSNGHAVRDADHGKPAELFSASFDTEDEAVAWIAERMIREAVFDCTITNKAGETTHHLPEIRRLIAKLR